MGISVGVIGAGYWGKNIVRNLLSLPGHGDVWIYDQRRSVAEELSAAYPTLKVASSLEELLKNDNLQALMVVTPPSEHYSLGKKILEAGKHLYVEKPFVTSMREATELIEDAERKNLRLMSGHTFLYSPAVRKIRDLVMSGDLGKIHFFSFRRVNLGIHRSDVNVVWDLLPNDLSMLLYWLGEDEELQEGGAFMKTVYGNHPDVAFLSLSFRSGAVAEGLVSWLSPRKIRETLIVGDRKMVVYNDMELEEKIKVYDKKIEALEPKDFGEYHLSYRAGDVMSPHIDGTEPLTLMVKDFVESIREGRAPLSDGLFALRVVRGILTLLERGRFS